MLNAAIERSITEVPVLELLGSNTLDACNTFLFFYGVNKYRLWVRSGVCSACTVSFIEGKTMCYIAINRNGS